MWRPTITILRKVILPSLRENVPLKLFHSARSRAAPRSTVRLTLIGASVGVVIGAGYGGYTHYIVNSKKTFLPLESEQYAFLKEPPQYQPHYKVINDNDNSNLKLVLFQYRTCPFCCKVRTYLDARGISYEVVEVDAVLRQAIKWSGYKKVPIVLAKVDGGYQVLNSPKCLFCCKVRTYLDARGISYEVVEVDAVLRQAIKWSGYKKVPIVLAKVDGGYQVLNSPKCLFCCKVRTYLDARGISYEVVEVDAVLRQAIKWSGYKKVPIVRTYLDARGISYEVVEVDAVLRQAIKWSGYKKVPIVLAKVDGGYQVLNSPKCLFCCKVRTYLDARGISYEVVEVDAVLRQAIKWSGYKKVPIVLAKVDGGYQVRTYLDARGFGYEVVEVDAVLRQAIKWSGYKKVPIVLAKVGGGYQQLLDSTAIISVLETYLRDQSQPLQEVVKYYPPNSFLTDDGKKASDITNKYFVMHNAPIQDKNEREAENEEREWRQWADKELVHMLSPNVYRTVGEALDTFKWFEEVGGWRQNFPAWECALMVYGGAAAMWLISKRLKARHNIEDARQALYSSADKWMSAVKQKGTPFLGGQKPNLADISVYGILSSIEGCQAFQDLRNSTTIGKWYDDVKHNLESQRGKILDASSLHAYAAA
ncbi:glutaredoxin domain-containing protein [Phthorimaea operculella]|nr:glutaredoxin domain-containing protein [Phthorimaea operculella]